MTAEISSLIAALRSGQPDERHAAAEKLANLESDAQGAAVALVEALASADDETREWVVAALEGLGAPRVEDLGNLAGLLRSPGLDSAYWAATLMGRLETGGAAAVPGLIEALLTHGELAVRQRAAWALGQIGPAAVAAREALQSAAESGDARLATLVREAIGRIG